MSIRLKQILAYAGLLAGTLNTGILLYAIMYSTLHYPVNVMIFSRDGGFMTSLTFLFFVVHIMGLYFFVRLNRLERYLLAMLGVTLACSGMTFLLYFLPYTTPAKTMYVFMNHFHEIMLDYVIVILAFASSVGILASPELFRSKIKHKKSH